MSLPNNLLYCESDISPVVRAPKAPPALSHQQTPRLDAKSKNGGKRSKRNKPDPTPTFMEKLRCARVPTRASCIQIQDVGSQFLRCSANFYTTSTTSWDRGFANMTAQLDLRVPMKLSSLPQSKRIPSVCYLLFSPTSTPSNPL